jgi:hypothetical protein
MGIIAASRLRVTPVNPIFSDSLKILFSVRSLNMDAINQHIMSIRRTSDNEEANIFVDSNGEISESSIAINQTTGSSSDLDTFIGANDGRVSYWHNQGFSTVNASQNSNNNQPFLYKNGTLLKENGKPCLLFEGGQNLNLPISDLGNKYTMISVLKKDSSQNSQILDLSRGNGVSGQRIGFFNNNFVHQSADVNGSRNNLITAVNLNQNLIFCNSNSTTKKTFYNNLLQGTKSINGYNPGGRYTNQIGKQPSGGQFLEANLQELFGYTEDKESVIDTISNNINNYYSIY